MFCWHLATIDDGWSTSDNSRLRDINMLIIRFKLIAAQPVFSEKTKKSIKTLVVAVTPKPKFPKLNKIPLNSEAAVVATYYTRSRSVLGNSLRTATIFFLLSCLLKVSSFRSYFGGGI